VYTRRGMVIRTWIRGRARGASSMAVGLAVVAVVAAVAATGCSAIFGLRSPERVTDAVETDSDAPQTDAPRSDAPLGGYHATAVRFDPAGGDYLTTAALAGATTSDKGTFSVWLHFNGHDGSSQILAGAQIIASGGIVRNANNKIQFQLNACNGAFLLDVQSAHTYTSASGWIHVLASWDLAANKAQLYINGSSDLAPGGTLTDGAICYTAPKWGIGGLSSATLDADVADWYASFGTAVDFDVVANRNRFSNPSGKPIDLAADCSNPTGVTPIGCFTGALATWPTNKGTGAGFTVHGDGLTAAPTSPSD
jgi:hypothetical protein